MASSYTIEPIEPKHSPDTAVLTRILDVARWAPSGDNAQPWRFTILDADTVRVNARYSPENVYELNDAATLTAVGMLLETIRLAASEEQRTLTWEYEGCEANTISVKATLHVSDAVQPDPLLSYVLNRSVNRKLMKRTPLTDPEKLALAESLGDGLRIHWFEGIGEVLQCGLLNAKSTHIRLSIPEAYHVHCDMLEWDANVSDDKMPINTFSISPLLRMTMKWALGSWRRVQFLNRYLMGTLMPQIELDLVPAVCCAGHFSVSAAVPIDGPVSMLRAGQSLQRFWLTATQLGLTLQPTYAPIIFSYYGRHDIAFTMVPRMIAAAKKLNERFVRVYKKTQLPAEAIVFTGRIGSPRLSAVPSRSLRLPLHQLIVKAPR